MIPPLLKKDSFLTGFVLGLVLPLVFYGLVLLIDVILVQLVHVHLTKEHHYLYLLSVAINLIPVRYYFVALKTEKSGRGVLLVTGVYILTYFFMFYQL